jgi:predicted O-linked N-acetylglucosamine transferase (SPINDLY family)
MKMSPFFKMYTVYCANQPNSMLKLEECKKNEKFLDTLKICETEPKCKGLTLNSYLIKPIQRICKYPLFFKKLIKNISPKDTKSLEILQSCLKKIEETTEYINEGKRLAEKLQRVVDIQNSLDTEIDLVTISRRFVREGTLTFSIDDSTEYQDCHIFLFNDLILITREKKESL